MNRLRNFRVGWKILDTAIVETTTAIVGGFLVSMLGGSRVQIGGPARGFWQFEAGGGVADGAADQHRVTGSATAPGQGLAAGYQAEGGHRQGHRGERQEGCEAVLEREGVTSFRKSFDDLLAALAAKAASFA